MSQDQEFDKEDEQVNQDSIHQIQKDEENESNNTEELAQIQSLMDKESSLNTWEEFVNQADQVQAQYVLSQKLKYDVTQVSKIEQYQRAMKYHYDSYMRYKAMLEDIAKELTTKPITQQLEYSTDQADQMRKVMEEYKKKL